MVDRFDSYFEYALDATQEMCVCVKFMLLTRIRRCAGIDNYSKSFEPGRKHAWGLTGGEGVSPTSFPLGVPCALNFPVTF